MKVLASASLLLLLAGTLLAATVKELPSPAGAGSGEPFLARGIDGSLLMSWLEPTQEKRFALRWARWDGTHWSAPITIAERDDFFVNWADFPSIIQTADGTMFAHWLQRNGASTYAYDVQLAISRDGGKSWPSPQRLNSDGKKVEHGFVSLTPVSAGAVGAVWLDGRQMKEDSEEGEMSLRFATIDRSGKIAGEAMLDGRVCDCCNTALTNVEGELLALYRDRSPEEIRDMSVFRRVGTKWRPSQPLHHDHWKIAGCPVNGPQVDSRGGRVAGVWFTAPEEKSRVLVAFSRDRGATFGKAIRVDAGSPLGRVDVLVLDNGDALVSWIENGEATGKLLARRIHPDGTKEPVILVASASVSRSSGLPRLALVYGKPYLAWTEAGEVKRVRVAAISMKQAD